MIVYKDSVKNFINQCNIDGTSALDIGDIVSQRMRLSGIGGFDKSQVNAWKASLPELAKVLQDSDINEECHVAVEYKMHQSNDRIDFLICGKDDSGSKNVVVIELKQWSYAASSNKKCFVYTNGGRGQGDYWHPSYQAANYSNILKNFNEYIRDNGVSLPACSYLHNMDKGYSQILDNITQFPLVSSAPVFYEGDSKELGDFINKYIKHPDKALLYEIEDSRIVPSKYLADMLSSAIEGNDFFSYDEAQATAVSQIVFDVQDATYYDSKKTIIIKGGAGTGKSVVAINALGQLMQGNKKGRKKSTSKLNCIYVTSNAAPRNLYTEELIKDDFTKTAIRELFKYPTVCVGAKENLYDCVFVDEAHRIFDFKGGVGLKKDAHVLESIIKSARVSVFFIDSNQAVTTTDYATIDRIKAAAYNCHSKVVESPQLELKTQFRISGGSEYISFIRTFLGYDSNTLLYKPKNYEFGICDSATELFKIISAKDKLLKKSENDSGKCRLVAGYTYEWDTKGSDRNDAGYDIILDNGNFKAKWNLRNSRVGDKYSWLNDPLSVSEVGCVHTCQGLDMNYCGVIIGKDLVYRDNKVCFDKKAIAKSDRNSGIKSADDTTAENLIRNTYYVLLTRGMLGTYVYCEDEALREYLKSFVNPDDKVIKEIELNYEKTPYSVEDDLVYIPVVGEIAAGKGLDAVQNFSGTYPVARRYINSLEPGKYFFLKVEGNSMINVGIESGDLVLIRHSSWPQRGNIVAFLIDGIGATLKTFYPEDDRVRLQPENPDFDPIYVDNDRIENGEARYLGVKTKLIKAK